MYIRRRGSSRCRDACGVRADGAHPGILVAVLSAAGISVSLMQTLIIPLIPELPKPAEHQRVQRVVGHHGDVADRGGGYAGVRRLGDMYGPKPMLIACALMLIAGSLIAATTSSLMPLIVGRGLQGFGAPDHSAWASACCGRACRRTGRQRNGFDERVAGRGRSARAAVVRGDRAALRLARRCSGSRPAWVWRRLLMFAIWCRMCRPSR